MCSLSSPVFSGDWPQYRYDAGRTGATSNSLPTTLSLIWKRELPAPKPNYRDDIRLHYDLSYEPVVMGKRMFVPSMVTSSMTALNSDTGKLLWEFFVDAPVRLAPVAWDEKVYFVSDDGFLYCLSASSGKLVWKFNGNSTGRPVRKILGNLRLISTIPARGGPVIANGIIYFGAGIWAEDGVFVHALNAKTGKVVWSNSNIDCIKGANRNHLETQKDTGIAPQGHLAIVDGRLIVPCGTQLPAIFDLKTGALEEPYTAGWGGRKGAPKGSVFVSGIGKYLITSGDIYDIRKKNTLAEKLALFYLGGYLRLQIDISNARSMADFRKPILTKDTMFCRNENGIIAYNITQHKILQRDEKTASKYRKKDRYPDKYQVVFPERWHLSGTPREDVKVTPRLYASVSDKLKSAMDATLRIHLKAGNRLYCGMKDHVEAINIPKKDEEATVTWRSSIKGTPSRMLAADGKLFIITQEGTIYAFGENQNTKPIIYSKSAPSIVTPDKWIKYVSSVLKETDTTSGFAVIFGTGSGRLAEEIVKQSKCNVIIIEPDNKKVTAMRKHYSKIGLYGERISIHNGNIKSYKLPPYMANLIISEDWASIGDMKELLFKQLYSYLRPYGGSICLTLPLLKQKQVEATIAQCQLPKAKITKASDFLMIVRAGKLQGSAEWSHVGANAANTVSAKDNLQPPLVRLWHDGSFGGWHRESGVKVLVAGGRVIIKDPIHRRKIYAYDAYTGRFLWVKPIPASHAWFNHLVVMPDYIYFTGGKDCLVYDASTGEEVTTIKTPPSVTGNWLQIVVNKDNIFGATTSHVICLDRKSHKVLWTYPREAKEGTFMILGDNRIFCINDIKFPWTTDLTKIKGETLDLKTGKHLWNFVSGGLFNAYNKKHDILITTSTIYSAKDGKSLCSIKNPLGVTDEKLISGSPKPGEQFIRIDNLFKLITGVDEADKMIKLNWKLCCKPKFSNKLITTRYGSAAFVDMTTGEVTYIYNMRFACSNSGVLANGILNSPNQQGGCTCNYTPCSSAFTPITSIYGYKIDLQ